MPYGLDDFSAAPTGSFSDDPNASGFEKTPAFQVPYSGKGASATATPNAPDTKYKDAAAAGAGLQVGGELSQGIAAFYAGRTNRAVDDFNARINDYKAKAATDRGIFESNQIGRRTGQVVAAQDTATAANGAVIGSGTMASVRGSTEAIGAQDMLQARTNALMQAWGFKAQAGTDRMRGDLAATAGRDAMVGSTIGATALGANGFYRLNN